MSDRDYITRAARLRDGNSNVFIAPEDETMGSFVKVTVTGHESLDRATKLLAGIEGGVEKAVKSAVSRTASHVRSNSATVIRERYAISKQNIRTNETVQVRYSYQNGVQAFVLFSGQLIPLHRFDGASPSKPTADTSKRYGVMFGDDHWRYLYPGVAASGHVLKSTSPHTFDQAFVAKMPSTGHIGIFERTGGMTSNDKDEIEELFGPSVSQMLGNQEVREKLTAEAMQEFDKRMDVEINRILNGWGG